MSSFRWIQSSWFVVFVFLPPGACPSNAAWPPWLRMQVCCHLTEAHLGAMTYSCLLLISRWPLSFDGLMVACLSVTLSVFVLLGVYRASWMCELTCFTKSGKLLSIISLNCSYVPFSVSPSGSPIRGVTAHWMRCSTFPSSLPFFLSSLSAAQTE